MRLKDSNLIRIGALIIVGLIIAAALSMSSSAKKTQAVKNCSFPDKSFCSTELRFKGLTQDGSYAEILNAEKPQYIVCNAANSVQSVCHGLADNSKVRYFIIVTQGQNQPYNESDALAFLNNYSKEWGPFSFKTAVSYTGSSSMLFAGHDKNTDLSLQFNKSNNGWQLASIEIYNQ